MTKTNQPNNLVKQQSSLVKQADGFAYRDLNKNGVLDVYEDPRQPVEARVEDLLSQMTLEEKAGTLFINGSVVNDDGSIEEKEGTPGFARGAKSQMIDQWMTHFNLWQIPEPAVVAAWYNNLQKFAETTRLGIPVTIASDPRNHFSNTIFSMAAQGFSRWCETPGFGALDDPDLVRECFQLGAAGYLPKSSGMDITRHALLLVRGGGVYVPSEALAPAQVEDKSGTTPGNPSDGTSTGDLTPRQRTVLSLLERGMSNKAIARELGIGEITVKAHVSAILRKLGVENRLQAIIAVREQKS